MDDQLNNDLKNHIIEVFDGYEAPAEAADAGWAELRKRFPAEKKRRIAAWWWSTAAAVLAFVLFGIWYYNQSKVDDSTTLVKNKHNRVRLEAVPSHQDSSIRQSQQGKWSSLQPVASASSPAMASVQLLPSHSATGSVPVSGTSSSNPYAATAIIDTSARTASYAGIKTQPSPGVIAGTDSTGHQVTPPVLAANTAQPAKDSVSSIKHAPTMADLLARDAKVTYKGGQSKATGRRMIFSVFAGTYLNYAKGSSNQLNAGAGVTSDIKLMKKLKLVTGIAIGQNSLKYDAQPTQPNVYAAAIAASGKINGDNSSMRLFAVPGFAATTSSNVSTQVSSYNASFTGLDIPVNIKYELNPDKNDSYISAGISSGTFINESYHYNYTSTLVSATSSSAETKTQFGSFDFARTLNLSFGVGTPLGKSNRLIIEPFLKYPLNGLGSQQIRFGASGINLKLRFQSHK